MRRLSPREEEIANLLSKGMSNSEIANELGMNEATVKTHVSRMLGKTGLSSRTAFAVLWLKHTQTREAMAEDEQVLARGEDVLNSTSRLWDRMSGLAGYIANAMRDVKAEFNVGTVTDYAREIEEERSRLSRMMNGSEERLREYSGDANH